MIRRFTTNLRLSWNVFTSLILGTNRRYLFFGLFAVILFVLQWLFNIDQLLQIVLGDSGLSFGDRISFLSEGFLNIFRFADNFVPIAMIVIAFLQAIAITLLISFQSIKKLKRNQTLPLGLSFIGVGCVACGGSILTPLLGLIASNVSVSFAESLSHALLVAAIVISYVSMNRISFYVARTTVG